MLADLRTLDATICFPTRFLLKQHTMSKDEVKDAALFSILKKHLSTALVGDILDTMGYHKQFLPPTITPLKPDMKITGRAMPVQEADSFQVSPKESSHKTSSKGPLANQAFGLMIDALDSLQPNEVYIATGSSSTPSPYALFGGLMSTRAQYLQSAGAILNGYVRDADEIERLGFPVWSTGLYAQDQGPRGKVIDYRCPIEVGGVRVMPGDLVFADREGVLIIPSQAEDEAVRLAMEKANAENGFADAIKNGVSVRDAFEKFGVM